MKKIKTLVLLASGALLLSACNNSTPTSETTEATTTATPASTDTGSVVPTGYFVVFVTNGGTAVQRLENVTTIQTAPVTTRHGYNFVGWFTSNTATDPVTFPLTITSNTMLYARWESIFTDATMSEAYWTETVKENRATLIGNRKGDNIDDFNFLTFYATRDEEGVYVFVKERVTGALLEDPSDWWKNNNFELHFNQTGEWDSAWEGAQLYASTLNGGYNFDVIATDIYKVHQDYDRFTNVDYKCFVSYETLSKIDSAATYNETSDIYIWYGSNSGHGFDHSESWEHEATVKIAETGILSRTDEKYATQYDHAHGGWDNQEEWATIDDELEDGERATLAIHLNGAINADQGNIGDIVWRTTLLNICKSDKTGGSVFRMDWFHFDFGGYGPEAFDNGSIWEYDSKTEYDTFKYYEVVVDCDLVYAVERVGNLYKLCTCIYPASSELVGRGDYVLEQSLTDSTNTMGAFISAEWANFAVYGK